MSSMLQLLLISLAGSTGALTRFLISNSAVRRWGSSFPYGVLIINISGSFFIGTIAGLAGRHFISPSLQSILATGFLGGYTTFSTFIWETLQMASDSKLYLSFLNILGSLLFGLIAVGLGLALGSWI